MENKKVSAYDLPPPVGVCLMIKCSYFVVYDLPICFVLLLYVTVHFSHHFLFLLSLSCVFFS